MSSSNSSKIEDQLTMAFKGIMEEAMSMLQAEATHFRLWHDYFNDDWVYPRPTSTGGIVCGGLFFLSIMHKLSETSPYFCERYDATGRTSLAALQKYTTTLRQLAYGMAVDTIDEYLKLGKTTALECLEYYCSDIIEYFGDEFLRCSTVADTQCLLAKAEERGFPGMLGSIDCMH
jgi:hypothetical protein